jgi:hypothetical protein
VTQIGAGFNFNPSKGRQPMFLLISHMKSAPARRHSLIAATILACLVGAMGVYAQAPPDSARNSQPNPYRTIENWAKLPEGRTWGAAAGVDVRHHGGGVIQDTN